MEGLEKMKIQHKVIVYEGVSASNAIGMALFESTGMRRLIDERCSFDREKRILSPGMVLKALIGPTFNITKKFPLYLVNTAYSTAPTDRLFGYGVTNDDLYDTALARGLDTLFDADLASLFWECAQLATKALGLQSNVFHMDSTDISFYGLAHEPDKEGAAVPRHSGHAKDHRNELLQYELQIVTDSNRIIRYAKPYSGNVADSVMDKETLDDFERIFTKDELSEMILVGDCKLATAGNIRRMIDMGMGFVSKCSETFKGKSKQKIRDWSVSAQMRKSHRDGLWMADTLMDVELSEGRTETLRFVAFRWDPKVEKAMEAVRSDAFAKASAIADGFKGTRFETEEAALDAVRDLKLDPEGPFAFDVSTVFYKSDYEIGPPGWWELKLEPLISERNVRIMAEKKETVVLVTNLDRPEGDGPGSAPGCEPASNEKVLRYYDNEYKVEQSFRLMKSGMGMNSIFLQTPSRENAMMFAISIAVLVSSIADALFREAKVLLDGRQLTMYRLAYEAQNTIVVYSRSENALSIQGPAGAAQKLFEITDALHINPQYLLGYLPD